MGSNASDGAKIMPFSNLGFQPRFAYGEQAEIAEVTGSEANTELGTGFARFALVFYAIHPGNWAEERS